MSPEKAKSNRKSETSRGQASQKAAARRRRTSAQRQAMDSQTNRVATELERFQARASDLRSKAERVVDRVKRLV